jgi:hypothetical protein
LGVLGFINIYFESIWTTILDVYSSIIININDLDIMDTLNSVYFEYIKILGKIFAIYILCPYYKFIQAILLHFLELLQIKSIIICIAIILYIYINYM